MTPKSRDSRPPEGNRGARLGVVHRSPEALRRRPCGRTTMHKLRINNVTMSRMTMGKMTRRTFGASSLALLLAGSASFAQQPAPVRVRGTVEGVDGDVVTVKSRDGAELKLKLKDNATVRAVIPAKLADIKAGTAVGIPSSPQADGSLSAIEVHIFPAGQNVNA